MKNIIRILSFIMVALTVLTCSAAAVSASEPEVVSNDLITEKSSDIIRISPSYPKIGEPMKIIVSGRENEEFLYRWYINDIRINNSADTYTPVKDDLEKTVTVEVYDLDAKPVGVKNIFISKIPVIYIETENRENIVVKEKQLNAQMRIQGNDEFNSADVLYNGDITIKGRGNTTWKYPKKPYKIKLDSKANLFGMGKNKHWVLLSNPVDTSGLRNDISYQLSGEMGLLYQDGTWVELILNGKDVGIYYLAEHIRVDSTRTDITDWESIAEDAAKAIYKKNKDVISKDQSEELIDLMTEDMSWTTSDRFEYNGVNYRISDYYDVPDINGGYLLELTNLAGEPSFTTSRNVSLEINTPETVSDDMKGYISSYVQAFEDALYSDDFCTEYNGRRMRYTEFIDVDSFAKGVILNELFQNIDFGCRSTYFYKDVNGKLVYGPLWDMDMCFNYNADNWISGERTWITRLYQDPVFMKRVRDIYWEYRYTAIEDILKDGGKIDRASDKIYEAALHNDKIWNSEVGFEENAADYKFRLQDKLNWLDSTLKSLETSHEFAAQSVSENIKLSFSNNILSITATDTEPTGFSIYVNGEFSQTVTDLSNLGNISLEASDGDIISVAAYSDKGFIGGNYICNQNYVTALSVVSNPSKTVYSAGDSIDLSDLVLKAVYKDGTTAIVNPDTVYTKVTDSLDTQLYCYNKVTDKCGSVVLVLSCGPESVSIPLSVNPKEDYELVERYISRIPTEAENTDFVKLTAEAWEQYEALSESAKAEVSNYQILSDAINVLNSSESAVIDCYRSSAMRDNARNNLIIAVKASPNAVTFSYGTDETKTTLKKNSIPQRLVGLKRLGDIEFWTVRRGLVAAQPTFTVTAKYSNGALYTEDFPSERLFNPTENMSDVAYPSCIFANEDFNITFNCSKDVTKVRLSENDVALVETEDFADGIVCSFASEGSHKVTLYYMCGGRWFEYKSFDMFAREPVDTTHRTRLDHTYTAVTTEPTCTEQGYTTYTCECGDSYAADYVEALGHSFGEWKVTTPATCTEDGEETRYCSRCDETETRTVPKLNHSYVDTVTKPTCTEQGYTTHTCFCGDSYVDSYVDAIGHSYGDWITASEATCTQEGVETRYCVHCNKQEIRYVSKTGHSFTNEIIKPTCTEQGYTVHTCACGDTYTDTYVNALGHSYGEWQVTTPATCTKEGIETRYCVRCDKTETRKISALGHSYGEWQMITPATCTQDGVETRYCVHCNKQETRYISKTGHSYTNEIVKPTCTEQGYTVHTCSCGDTYKDTYVSALGHTYGEWKVTTPATCTKEGVETRYCSRCDKTETRKINALGHIYGEWTVTTSATCTEEGVETRYCTGCDRTETRKIAKLSHTYTDTVTKPTCTEKGYTTHTCSCGETYVDSYVDALGHTYGKWTVTTPATCTEEGVETRYCTRCDAAETRKIAKLSHTYTDTVTKPTCTEKGYTTHTCSCGETYVDSYVDALGHTYGKWTVTTPATCIEEGVETRYCTRCSAAETRKIAKLSHTYTDTVTKPTCTEKGYTTHTCSCGETYVDSYVDALGHSYGSWSVVSQATCTEDGVEARYCVHCGKQELRYTSKTGHSYTHEIVKPTCTEKGYTVHTCSCGNTYKDTYINALGHTYGEWKVTKAATCTVSGTETRYCTVCDKAETRKINAIGHSYGEWQVTTPATCTEEGVETRYCLNCGRADTRVIPKAAHSYTDVVTAPTCTEKGFTTHTCSCGDTYVDSFVEVKGHTDGEWKITKPATYTAQGEKTLYCKECGTVIRTEAVPKLEGRVVSVSIENVDVKYKSGATIKPEIKTEGGIGYTVKYESSNTKVASVDGNGNITTHQKGTAKITCTVTDEAGNTVKDTRTVNVKFSFGQWLIWIFLFGFLWY